MEVLIPALKLTFGKWLKLMRSSVELSQAQLAEALNVNTQTIRNWEADRSDPSLNPSQTKSLCTTLKTDLDKLANAFEGEAEVKV